MLCPCYRTGSNKGGPAARLECKDVVGRGSEQYLLGRLSTIA
jgi:hypothetical protein